MFLVECLLFVESFEAGREVSANHLHEGKHMFAILTGTRRVNYFVKTLVLNLVYFLTGN